MIEHLKQENAYIHIKLDWLHHDTVREFPKLTTITFRSLLRLHQIMISLVPYIYMPAESHTELCQLELEFMRKTQQLRSSLVNPIESQIL